MEELKAAFLQFSSATVKFFISKLEKKYSNNWLNAPLKLTYLKPTIEVPEKYVKYVQS